MYIIEKCLDPDLLTADKLPFLHLMIIITHSLPMLVFAGMCYALWWATFPTRSGLHALIMSGLVLVNVLIGHGLKYLINWPRLHPTCEVGHLLKVGSSFPSVHASVVVCLSVYYSYCFYKFTEEWSDYQRYARIFVVNLYAGLVCISRVYLELNLLRDIVVGSFLGSGIAIIFISVFLGDDEPLKVWKKD